MKIDKYDENVITFINSLWLKNILVTKTESDIIEMCKDEEIFLSLLIAFRDLMQVEQAFMHLDDSFTSKLEEVIYHYRFLYKDSSWDMVNDAIGVLNLLNSVPSNRSIYYAFEYRSYQEDVRKENYCSLDQFLNQNASDIIVFYNTLAGGNLVVSREQLVASYQYFSEVCPEMFLNDEFYANAQHLLHQAKDVPLYQKVSKEYRDVIDVDKKITLIKSRRTDF